MSSPRVTIVDYGVGNLFNVVHALKRAGAEVVVSGDPAVIAQATKIVLPGVGAFSAGMDGLRERGLIEPLRHAALDRKVPFFGICLGMQLLMERSEELGSWLGLALVPGTVTKLTPLEAHVTERKVPHMGWNTVSAPESNPNRWRKTIFSDIAPASFFYFVHSFYVSTTRANDVLGETTYGGQTFCAALESENLMGCQFHPEKSGEVGGAILKNFVLAHR
jgi:glutamine amidotransferase